MLKQLFITAVTLLAMSLDLFRYLHDADAQRATPPTSHVKVSDPEEAAGNPMTVSSDVSHWLSCIVGNVGNAPGFF